jgi:hypothetical protein
MNDDEERCLRWRPRELEDDALADAPNGRHDPPEHGIKRRIDGAKDEGTEEGDLFERTADDVAVQRLEVDDDVG